MTLSPSLFRNAGAATVALFYTALTFGALVAPTPAEARTNAVYYTAELAAPAKESRTIIRGMVWHCEGTTCKARKGNSRPVITCKRLANEMGEITEFTAKGEALAEEKLAKCND